MKKLFRSAFFYLSVLPAAIFLIGFLPEAQPQVPPTQKALPAQKVSPIQKVEPKIPTVARFKLGEFTVVVGSGSATGRTARTTAPSRDNAISTTGSSGSGLSGQGRVTIISQNVPVTFSGIVLSQGASGEIPIATAGSAQGTAGTALEYALDGFRIRLERSSLRLTPETATASVVLSLGRAPFLAEGQDNILTLTSRTCGIAPDGTVHGGNFHGTSSFRLKDCPYGMRIMESTDQTVSLSERPAKATGLLNPAAKSTERPTGALAKKTQQPGVTLRGIASTVEGLDLFAFDATIDREGKAALFGLALLNAPHVSSPEPGYSLSLQAGSVRYDYSRTGALTCGGEFTAEITLPETVKNENSRRIVLPNVLLKTDQTGTLFNAITISDKIRAGFNDVNRPGGAIFLLEPAPESAFIYFPRWEAPQNSSYDLPMSDQKKGPDCQALEDFLRKADSAPAAATITRQSVRPAISGSRTVSGARISPERKVLPSRTQNALYAQNEKAEERNVFGRPGLTVLQGTLHMRSPQSSFPGDSRPPSGEWDLKTLFWGLVTATPWGMTGSLTSSACSFIPESHPIEECTAPSGAGHPAWEDILRDQANDPTGQPQKKRERFRLADLQILEMKLRQLSLCMNVLPENGAKMATMVHFPFPSYIDVDFIDQSLDSQGLFHAAEGPIATIATLPSPPTAAPEVPSPDAQASFSTGPRGPMAEAISIQAGGQVSAVGPLVLKSDMKEVPQTRILWAWRLPVTLVANGVKIAYPQGRGSAEVRVVMSPSQSGEITSCEIWLKPLYSRNSAVKAGVRFEAALTGAGEFRLTRWDHEPLLSVVYPSNPQQTEDAELQKAFPCRLDGITLADAGPGYNTETRDRDFGWVGAITFPFFGEKPVAFGVKKIVPFMAPIDLMQNTGGQIVDCLGGGDNPARMGPDPDPSLAISLTLTVRDLTFSPTGSPFISRDVSFQENEYSGNAVSITFSSYIYAQVQKERGVNPPVDVTSDIAPGQQTKARHWMKDWIDKTGVIDIACYDQRAFGIQGRLGLPINCCDDYWFGTYEVVVEDKVILSTSNTKLYRNRTPAALVFSGTRMGLTPEGDTEPGGNSFFLDIPGAVIKIENGNFYGDFDTASLPAFMPGYRGECAFYLNPRDGYFGVMISCSFPITPIPINAEGVTYIFHAPRNELDNVLERAADWALYTSRDHMASAMGMTITGITGRSILSGALTTGNAARNFTFGPLEVGVKGGGGLFFYRYKNEDNTTGYNYGIFQNNRGVADLSFLSAEVVIDFTIQPNTRAGSIDSVRDFFRDSDLTFHGAIFASVCASCKLAYAMVELDLSASYSLRNGFNWSAKKPIKASAGLGGC